MLQVSSHLLSGDRHVVLHVTKDGWLDEIASVCSRVATTQQFGSFTFPSAYVTKDLLKLLFINLRATRTDRSASPSLEAKQDWTPTCCAHDCALAAPHFNKLPSQPQREMATSNCQHQVEGLEPSEPCPSAQRGGNRHSSKEINEETQGYLSCELTEAQYDSITESFRLEKAHL